MDALETAAAVGLGVLAGMMLLGGKSPLNPGHLASEALIGAGQGATEAVRQASNAVVGKQTTDRYVVAPATNAFPNEAAGSSLGETVGNLGKYPWQLSGYIDPAVHDPGPYGDIDRMTAEYPRFVQLMQSWRGGASGLLGTGLFGYDGRDWNAFREYAYGITFVDFGSKAPAQFYGSGTASSPPAGW